MYPAAHTPSSPAVGAHQSRRGAALVLVASVLILLTGLALMMTEATVANVKEETHRRNDLALLMATESAANLAMNHLQRNTTLLTDAINNKDKDEYFLGQTALGLTTTDGRINGKLVGASWRYLGKRWVQANGTPLTTQPADPYNPGAKPAGAYEQDSFLMTTVGTTGTEVSNNDLRAHRIDTLITPYPVTAVTDAMFANLGYHWSGSAKTDSFDSEYFGPHPNWTDKTNKDPFRTNGDIGSTTAITGTDDDPTTGPVYGETKVDPNKVLPPVIYPYEHAPASSPITGPTTLVNDTYHCTFIDTSGGPLTIQGTVTIYVDSWAKMTGGVKYADAFSFLKIIQNNYKANLGETSLNGNDVVGDPTNPTRYWFMTAFDGQITFNGNAAYGGVIYAPKATFKLNGTFDFYGAIVANYFGTSLPTGEDDMGKVVGNFWFHYDERLGRMSIPLTPRLGVIGWRSRPLAAGEVAEVSTIIKGLP